LIWALSLRDPNTSISRSSQAPFARVASAIRTELTFRPHKCEVIPTAARLDGFFLALTIYQISESRV